MKRWTKLILGVMVLVTVFVWAQIVKSPTADSLDENVHIFFLNVGQGDTELIQEGNYQILIDGGPDDSVLSQIGKAMPISDRKIETLILTHPHADHLAGLNLILDRYDIGEIYYSGVIYDSNGYDEFLDKAKAKNIPLKIPEVGQTEKFFADSQLTFLWPGEEYKDQKIDNLNNSSEVVKFCYFSHCVLFTGDIETDEQVAMFNFYSSSTPKGIHDLSRSQKNSSPPTDALSVESNNNPFQTEVLKLPHHGSINGTNQALIDSVKPKMAVFEVGAENKYGHPHASVLDLLDKNNIKYYRTDRDGMIELIFGETGIIKK